MIDHLSMLLLNIQSELEMCQQIMRDEFQSDVTMINDIRDYVIQRPGKMLRPAVVIASAKVCGATNTESVARVAAVLEMMHNATLIHDDAIDNAETRRGKAAVHRQWDRQSAILIGDYLFAKALRVLLKEGNIELLQVLGDATVSMCEAELYQMEMSFNPHTTRENYFRLVEGKTANLVAAGCQLGAVIGGADPALKDHFWHFGMKIGTAFQIIDDLFDYTGEADEVGKPVGQDLIEGKVTLPLIQALDVAPRREADHIRRVIAARDLNSDDWSAIKAFVEKYDGVGYSRQLAQRLIQDGLDIAGHFPQSLFKFTMMHLAKFVLRRSN